MDDRATVLVTGAAGDLGRRVTGLLGALPNVERVLAVDVAQVPRPAPKLEAHVLDLSLPSAVDELTALAKQAGAVVHLAWQAEGKANLAVMRNVLDVAEAVEPAQFLQLSSATVYGAWPDNPVPMTEETEPRPNGALQYAVEKRDAELMLERWARGHPGTAVAVLRPACTVGGHVHPLYQALASSRRQRAGAEGRVVQYLHVDDLAEAVVHVYHKGLSGVFNVAPDAGIREELAVNLLGRRGTLALSGPFTRITRLGRRARRRGQWTGSQPYTDHSWAVAGDRLRQAGWRPEYTSEQALVVSDPRRHWDELPQGKRVLVVLGSAGAAVAAAGTATALWWHRRR